MGDERQAAHAAESSANFESADQQEPFFYTGSHFPVTQAGLYRVTCLR